MWLRSLLREIQAFDRLDPTETIKAPTPIMEDNTAAAQWANNPISHARQRHIDAHHAIRDWVAEGSINIKYVPTMFQLADAFTKSLPPDTFLKLTDIYTGRRIARETLERASDQPVCTK